MGRMHFNCYSSIKNVKIAAVCDSDHKKLAPSLSSQGGNIEGADKLLNLSGIELFDDLDTMLNKTDLDPDGEYTKDIVDRLGKECVMTISAVAGTGLTELNEKLWSIAKGRDTDESDSD